MLNPPTAQNPPEIISAERLVPQASALAGDLRRQIDAIDQMLHEADDLLHILQPVLSGRIRIVFWKERGFPTPRAAEATRPPGFKLWSTERLKGTNLVRRAKRAGPFAENHEAVKKVLELAQQLLADRKAALKVQANYSRAVKARVKKSQEKATAHRSSLAVMQHLVGDALANPPEDDLLPE